MMYDIIIVGAGPAGLTAAIYARRADKRVLVLEKETFGGQITFSPCVENYPGFVKMSGNEFAERLIEQAQNLGADIDLAEVTGIEVKGTHRVVHTDNGDYETRAVILATGSRHRPLGVAREEEFIGEGVSYCAVCDGAFYADRDVAVIGGGNSALQEAVLLADTCRSVTVVQNLDFLTGEARLAQKLAEKSNVRVMLGYTVEALLGDRAITGVTLKDQNGKKTNLSVDGVFVCIGQIPENGAFADLIEVNEVGYIVADESCLTRDEAVFVAGDCRTKGIRQITTATGDGATAAIAACRYLDR